MTFVPSGNWIGDLRGTVVAHLFAEFSLSGEKSIMSLRAGAQGAAWVFSGEVLNIAAGSSVTLFSPPASQPFSVRLTFDAVDQQSITARWETQDGNAGILRLSPVSAPNSAAADSADPIPLRVINKPGSFPKTRLYRDDLQHIIAVLKESLPSPFDVVVRFKGDDSFVSYYAADAWKSLTLPRKTNEISLSLNDQSQPVNRAINVNFSKDGCSFAVTGSEEIWVNGAFERIRSLQAFKRSVFRKIYEDRGLWLNSIMFLAVLAYLPDLTLSRRITLIIAIVALAAIFKHIFDLTTATLIYLREDRKSLSLIDLPRLLTTLLGAAVVAAVPWLFSTLQGDYLQTLLINLISNWK